MIGLLLEALEMAGIVLGATRRMRRAERELDAATTSAPLVPPAPPPLGHSGYPEALAYVRGRDDAMAQREEQERLGRSLEEFARKAALADDERGEPEKPIGEGEAR